MANKNWPFGLQAVRGPNNAAPEITRYPLKVSSGAPTYATKIYKGAPVKWAATGYLMALTAGDTNLVSVVGVAAEYYAGSANSSQVDLGIWDGKEHVFAVQADESFILSDLHKNGILVSTTAGNTQSGLSKIQLDVSSMTSADKLLRVVGRTAGEIGNNDAASSYVNVHVVFNKGHLWQDIGTSP